MPEGAVAAPPAAPAAAPSAPAASSSAIPTPAPAPVESTPAAAPAAEPISQEQTPAAAASAAAGPKEPSQDDYPGDVEAFLKAHNAWERGEDVPPAAQPAEGEAQPAPEAPKPEEKAKTEPAEPVEAATPEALNKFMEEDAGFKAAIEANPQLKGALFQMARKYAEYEPIAQLFAGSVDAAKFAEQAAGTMVEVRSSFLEAIESGDVGSAYERFAQEFQERDKEGKPVTDGQGNPVYGDDFHLLNDFIVDTYHDIEISDLEASLEANQFPSEEAREQADMALQAFKYIQDFKKGNVTGKPDLSKIDDPQLRAHYEQRERELQEREQALNGNKRQQTAVEKKAERANFEQGVARKVGQSVGQRIQNMIADQEKLGVFIPSYVMEAKDPGTGINLFAKTLLDKLEESTYGRYDAAAKKVIGGVSHLRNQAKMLALRPPSPEAEQDRVNFALKLIDDHLPQIFQSELRQIQRKAKADADKRASGRQNVDDLVAKEPRGGQAPAPKTLSAQDAMNQAYQEVDQKYPDLNAAERLERALQIKNRIMGSGY